MGEWKLVPVVPTEEMMQEGMEHINDGDQRDIDFPTLYPSEFWKAALAAAPVAPSATASTPSAPKRERDPTHEIYCHACSVAGGAERAIYHLPPACSQSDIRGQGNG